MQALKSACLLPVLLAAALPLHAQDDPLKSQACGAAIASLQAARQGRADAGQVEALRSQAATACLGMGSPPARPSRALQAPIQVPPPQVDVPVAVPAIPGLPALTPPPPPVAVDRPAHLWRKSTLPCRQTLFSACSAMSSGVGGERIIFVRAVPFLQPM